MSFEGTVGGIGQILGMLFGSSSEQTGHGNSTSNTKGTTTTDQSGQQRTMSEEDMQLLRNLGAILTQNSTQYSKGNAIHDSAALQAQSLRTLREGVLPNIRSQEAQAGSYNSTSRKLLSNDATNRAADSLAMLRLNAIQSYGQLQNQNLSSAAAALAALKGGLVTSTEHGTTAVDSTTDTQSYQQVNQSSPGLFSKIF